MLLAMKNRLDSNGDGRFILIGQFLKKSLKRWPTLGMFILVFTLNALRVPSGLVNFWAEDGLVFYSDVINFSFPHRFFMDSGQGGYLNASGKLIAEFIKFFPIDYAPVANFVLVNAIYALILKVVYSQLKSYFIDRIFLYLLMGFIAAVPIASFDSTATSINLHFFLIFARFIILITDGIKPTLLKHLIIIMACLSDPLMLLFAPAIILKIIKNKTLTNSYLYSYFISTCIQGLAIMQFFGNSSRVIDDSFNVIKASYLFMDRVIGSSLIPGWGFIDGQTIQNGGVSRELIIRLSASLLALVFYSIVIYSSFKAIRANFSAERINLTICLIMTLCLYWVVTGLFFSPEPRYAIFPSLCIATTLLLGLDINIFAVKQTQLNRFLRFTVILLFAAIFAGAFQISSIRETNLDWRQQIVQARNECNMKALQHVKVLVPPENHQLGVKINCVLLSK